MSEYDAITLIQPIKFNLPIVGESSGYFKEIVGKRKSRGVSQPGVYVFINKRNGCCYVGSTKPLGVDYTRVISLVPELIEI